MRLPGAKHWSQQLILGTSNQQDFLGKLLGEGLHSHRCSLEGFSILGSSQAFGTQDDAGAHLNFAQAAAKGGDKAKFRCDPAFSFMGRLIESYGKQLCCFSPAREDFVTVISLTLGQHSSFGTPAIPVALQGFVPAQLIQGNHTSAQHVRVLLAQTE